MTDNSGDGVKYLTLDKKQLEYMRVVNLTDVGRRSKVRDKELLSKMERALIREQIEKRKKKEKAAEPDQDEQNDDKVDEKGSQVLED